MKIETLEKDLRNVDEIVIKTGEFVNGNNAEIVSAPRASLFYVYWLAVAVWHILDYLIRKEKEEQK